MDPAAEITLEANPTSVEASRFGDYSAAGINRVSIGVQSLDDRALKFLGRQHTSHEALEAVALARRGFERVSFDLIYGRPGQTEAAWRDELGAALDLEPDHLSLYQLTIEPGTAFAALHDAGSLAMPDDDHLAALYRSTGEFCAERGLAAYEVSNYALPGAESRHNLVYWRYGEYAGVGPGAHSRLVEPHGRVSIETIEHPETWLEAVRERGTGHAAERPLSQGECADEMLLMGLRLSEGVSLERYAAMGGTPIDSRKLDELVGLGLIAIGPGGGHDPRNARRTSGAECRNRRAQRRLGPGKPAGCGADFLRPAAGHFHDREATVVEPVRAEPEQPVDTCKTFRIGQLRRCEALALRQFGKSERQADRVIGQAGDARRLAPIGALEPLRELRFGRRRRPRHTNRQARPEWSSPPLRPTDPCRRT